MGNNNMKKLTVYTEDCAYKALAGLYRKPNAGARRIVNSWKHLRAAAISEVSGVFSTGELACMVYAVKGADFDPLLSPVGFTVVVDEYIKSNAKNYEEVAGRINKLSSYQRYTLAEWACLFWESGGKDNINSINKYAGGF